MESVRVGRSGLQVSRLCLGTMNFGSQRDHVQEPRAEDYGVRDCAFRDPARNLVRIQERR